MPPHGHHGGGGGGHHHHGGGGGVHHYQHHPQRRQQHFQHHHHHGTRYGGGGTNVLFVGGAPGYYSNTYYNGYGGYFGPTVRYGGPVAQCCHQESCAVTYYDYRADDTVVFECACDDGTCANRGGSSGNSAQTAFGILFILYFFFGLFVACYFQGIYNTLKRQQAQNNVDLEQQNNASNDTGIMMNPMQPNVDLDTSRPFATNPQFTGTVASPPSPPPSFSASSMPTTSVSPYFSEYSALPTHSPTSNLSPSAPPVPTTASSDYSYPVVEAVPVMLEAVAVPQYKDTSNV